MATKFECHITIPSENYKEAEPIAKSYKFHMSNITDDIQLGPGEKAYCTRTHNDFVYLMNKMDDLTIFLRRKGIKVIRRKIEAILFDEILTT